MGNTTTIPQNTTTNSSINATTPPPTAEPPVPYYPSKDETIEQIFGTGSLLSIGIIVNILVIICIRLRLRSALYLFLENLAVVDILTSLASGPLWIFGMMLFSTGFTLDLDFKLFSFFCRVSGFVHTSLITVFLNTIIVISVSRLFFLLSPTIYITIFPNNVTNRILLFAVWMYSIALSAPPLNPGIWGEYYRFDTICIPKWSSSGDLSYPLFHTILTLAPAVFCTAAAIVVIIFKKKTRVEPENDARVNQVSLKFFQIYLICRLYLGCHAHMSPNLLQRHARNTTTTTSIDFHLA